MPRLSFTSDEIIKRLRWIALLVMVLDGFVTLFCQPWMFWQDSKKVWENDLVWRFFLAKGMFPFIGAYLFYVLTALLIASVTPRAVGIAILFWLLFTHVCGVESWLAFRLQKAFELGIAVLITFALCKPGRRHLNSPDFLEPSAVDATNSAARSASKLGGGGR